jgi:maleylpyruvate isomerase
MSERRTVWLRDGTAQVLGVVDRLSDAALREPSGLPGWTRAHVVGHLARNADALGRLADWARTGVQTPMYRDREQRAAEIEESAAQPAAVLRRDVAATAVRLAEKLAVPGPYPVRTATGRTVPATEIPWMRVREVWLHAVDLKAGFDVAELPADLVDALLDDVTPTLSARPGCPGLLLVPDDRDRTWRLGPGPSPVEERTGPAARLLAWVTGRDGGGELPSWL